MNRRRMLADKVWLSLSVVAVIIAAIPLASILYDVASKGLPAMNLDFFTQLPPPPLPGATGGLGNALEGSLLLVGLASLMGLPLGILSGIYISEFGNNYYGASVRFLGDVLVGNPSIVVGILGFILLVLPLQGFSIVAGAFALGTMMIPIVSNTTAESLKLVPNSFREASMGLGVRKWRTILLVTSLAKGGVATGVLLAVARVLGETAPLILTAGISQLWFSTSQCHLIPDASAACLTRQPVASLTYFIYYFATSPFSNWQSLAWGAALVLIVIIMGINVAVRFATRGGRAHA